MIVDLLKQHPSQIEPTLQLLRSSLTRVQTLQRGASDSRITPTLFTLTC